MEQAKANKNLWSCEALGLPDHHQSDLDGLKTTLGKIQHKGDKKKPELDYVDVAQAVIESSTLAAEEINGRTAVEAIGKIKMWVITQGKLKADKLPHAIELLNAVVRRGNELGLWDLPLPGPLLKYERPMNPLAPPKMDRLGEALAWRQQFVEALKNGPSPPAHSPEEAEFALGRLVISAALFGGLTDTASIRGLCRQFGAPAERFEDLFWIDIVPEQAKGNRMETRRWFPDPLSLSLLTKNTLSTPKQWMEKGHVWRNQSINRAITCFTKTANIAEFPRSVTELVKAGEAMLGLQVPGYLRRYSQRKQVSHSIRHEAWLRILGAQQEESRSIDQDSFKFLTELSSSVEEEASQGFVVSSIRSCLDSKQLHDRIGCLHNLKFQAEAVDSPVPAMLIDWMEYLSTYANTSGTRLRPGTLQGYLGNIGQRLVEAHAELDDEAGWNHAETAAGFDWTDPEQLSHLYALVLDDAVSANHRKHMVRALREFHAFLRKTKIKDLVAQDSRDRLPDNDRYDFETIARQASEVDANVIRYDEYMAIRKAIQNERYRWQNHPDYRLIAECLVILGYRCGTRRSESLYLRLGDCFMSGETDPQLLEVWIQPYPGRSLKTSNARRRLPVQFLLNEEERKVLESWIALKRDSLQGETSRQHEVRLFTPRGQVDKSIKDDSQARYLYGGIRAIINEVTGDGSLRYHHFRHSFGSWLLFALQWNSEEYRCEQVKTMLGEWLETAQVINHEFLRNKGDQKKHLYFVSMLLGHSTPAISLEHYLHFQDLLLAAAHQRLFSTSGTGQIRTGDSPARDNELVGNIFANGELLSALGLGNADYLRQAIHHHGHVWPLLRERRYPKDDNLFVHPKMPPPWKQSQPADAPFDLLTLLDEVRLALTHTSADYESPILTTCELRDCVARLERLAGNAGANNVKRTRHPLAVNWLEARRGSKPTILRKAAEKRMYEVLVYQLEENISDDASTLTLIDQALPIFEEHSQQQTSVINLPSPEIAKSYMDFHQQVLGVNTANFAAELTIDKRFDQAGFETMYQRWQTALGGTCPPRYKVLRKGKQGENGGRVRLHLLLEDDGGSKTNEGLFGYRYFMTLVYTVCPSIKHRQRITRTHF